MAMLCALDWRHYGVIATLTQDAAGGARPTILRVAASVDTPEREARRCQGQARTRFNEDARVAIDEYG